MTPHPPRDAVPRPVPGPYGLALDPGAKGGWALSFRGAIVACGLVRVDKGETMRRFGNLSWIVCEDQQLYPSDITALGPARAAKKARDLIVLARRAQALCDQALGGQPGAKVTWVLPHAWKGSVPKGIHNERVLVRLTDQERALVHGCTTPALVNNVIDAVGLNLWQSGRYRP